jgi:O-antigen/teichoic acid export membrane protein
MEEIKPNKTGYKSLKLRVLKAGSWSMGQMFATYALRLGSNLILTRVLAPEAFGLMAIVFILISAFELFSDIGIQRSIIREIDGDSDRFLKASWTIKCIRGLIIFTFVVFISFIFFIISAKIAPPGSVYADPRLPTLIATSALIPLISGLTSTCQDLAVRQFNQRLIAITSFFTYLLGVIFMIIYSSFIPSVWAIMLGTILISLLRCASSHIFFPGPKMEFTLDYEVRGRIWNYGKYLMGSSAFTFVGSNADRIIIGAYLPVAAFGVYSISMIWVGVGVILANRVASQIVFPAISEVIRINPSNLSKSFRIFQTVFDVFCLSIFIFLSILSEKIIDFLYRESYADAGTYLSILALSFLSLRFDTLYGLLMNLGNSRAVMIISAVRALSVIFFVSLGIRNGGINAALFAAALAPAIAAPYAIALLIPNIGVRQAVFDFSIWILIYILGYIIYASH